MDEESAKGILKTLVEGLGLNTVVRLTSDICREEAQRAKSGIESEQWKSWEGKTMVLEAALDMISGRDLKIQDPKDARVLR
jgi:hypothetical protein